MPCLPCRSRPPWPEAEEEQQPAEHDQRSAVGDRLLSWREAWRAALMSWRLPGGTLPQPQRKSPLLPNWYPQRMVCPSVWRVCGWHVDAPRRLERSRARRRWEGLEALTQPLGRGLPPALLLYRRRARCTFFVCDVCGFATLVLLEEVHRWAPPLPTGSGGGSTPASQTLTGASGNNTA